jgi:hypothetical protein
MQQNSPRMINTQALSDCKTRHKSIIAFLLYSLLIYPGLETENTAVEIRRAGHASLHFRKSWH